MPDAIDSIMQEMLNAPGARERVVQGFDRRTQLTPEQEKKFRAEATAMGHDPKSFDDPTYDMRAAWLAGRLNPPTMHGSSEFKGLGDSRLFLPIGQNNQMVDTRTARPGPNDTWLGPQPSPQLLGLWNVVSQIMNAPKDKR